MKNITHENLLKIMFDYYYFTMERLPNNQDNIFRTYLWVASFILSLNIIVLKEMLEQMGFMPFYGHFGVFSIAVAGFLICFCLYAMKGTHSTEFPDIQAYYNRFQDESENEGENINWLKDQLWKATTREREAQSRRGRRLRYISWGLLVSFSLLMVTVSCLYFGLFIH